MKCIIIGLGNFGSSLAQELARVGHEVIGVDNDMAHVEAMKGDITHTICLDATDEEAVGHLPLDDTDIVMVCIGGDEGANLMSTALMKKLKVERVISRVISPLHQTILEAMQVDQVMNPEVETAVRWANKLDIQGVIDSFEITADTYIMEATVPKHLEGKTLAEAELNKEYGILVLTTIEVEEEKNQLGILKESQKARGIATSDTRLNKGDIMVMYGRKENIEQVLNK